jgi:hypothetical protein
MPVVGGSLKGLPTDAAQERHLPARRKEHPGLTRKTAGVKLPHGQLSRHTSPKSGPKPETDGASKAGGRGFTG